MIQQGCSEKAIDRCILTEVFWHNKGGIMREQELYINGTRIYSLTNHDLHSFCLSLYIRAGSIFEDMTENGISHLFEHMVFRNLKNKYENF